MSLRAVSPASPAVTPTRVAIVADHGLIAEAVRAALVGRGCDVAVVRWPSPLELSGAQATRRRPRRRRSAGPPPDVALMLSDLDRTEVVHTAQSLIEGLAVPWLVLTGAPRGPVWGALYEKDVSLVVSARTRLDLTCELIEDLGAGRPPHRIGRRHRKELIRSWRSFAQERGELLARMRTLTERETEVLQRLWGGQVVRTIAEQSEVTESTVRSQVKAILRKLDVSSQLAAVAVYESIQRDSTEPTVFSHSEDPTTV